jgi:hypothetical protein
VGALRARHYLKSKYCATLQRPKPLLFSVVKNGHFAVAGILTGVERKFRQCVMVEEGGKTFPVCNRGKSLSLSASDATGW